MNGFNAVPACTYLFRADVHKMDLEDTFSRYEYAFLREKYAADGAGAAVPFDDGEPITDVHSACDRLKRKGLKAVEAESGLRTSAAPFPKIEIPTPLSLIFPIEDVQQA